MKSVVNVELNDILVEVFVWVTRFILIPIQKVSFELEFSDTTSTFHCSSQNNF